MPKSIKQLIRRDIDTYGAEWIDEQPVLLGDYTGTVQSPTPGVFYARQYNGKVVETYNTANVPPTFDLHVIIGRKKSLPTIWQIIAIREAFLTPAGGGQIAAHHLQHELPNFDTGWWDRKQILSLTVLVYDAAGFIVQVFGSVVHTATGIHKIAHQLVDLSSYVVTVGAKFVSIETDDAGVLSVHAGVAFDAPEIGTDADIPVPAPGKYLIAFILLYDGQTELSDADIAVPFPLGVIAKSSGLQINEAEEVNYLHEQDEIGLWESLTGEIRKIKWASVKNLLRAYFNRFYSTVAHTHPEIETGEVIAHTHEVDQRADMFNDGEGDPAAIGTAADGASTYAARRDHVHAAVSEGAVLGSSYGITADNTWEDTGLSVTLPNAGTYVLDASVRAILQNNVAGAYIVVKLYNSTDAADVANSETLGIYANTANVSWQNQVSMTMPPITVAASKTIKLYAWRAAVGTYTSSSIGSDSSGRTRLRYIKTG